MVGNSGKRWKRTKQPVFPTDTFNIFAIKLEHPHPYKHWRYLHEFSSLYFWKQTMCKLKKQNKHHDLQCKIKWTLWDQNDKIWYKMFNATKYYVCCFNKQVTRPKKIMLWIFPDVTWNSIANDYRSFSYKVVSIQVYSGKV